MTILHRINLLGQVTIPASMRKKYGFTHGNVVTFEDTGSGVLVRPVVVALEHTGKAKTVVLEKSTTKISAKKPKP